MKDERKGIDKSAMLKEAKENSDLVEFIKSITKEEIQRIKETREYESIKPGTPTYKIAVLCDALRQNARRLKLMIRSKVNSIQELQDNINRLNVQLEMNDIREVLKDGVVMNESELRSLIAKNHLLKDGEFYSLYPDLAELRSIVAHKDVSKRVIMSLEEFDKYVEQLACILKQNGYDLFGEIDG